MLISSSSLMPSRVAPGLGAFVSFSCGSHKIPFPTGTQCLPEPELVPVLKPELWLLLVGLRLTLELRLELGLALELWLELGLALELWLELEQSQYQGV